MKTLIFVLVTCCTVVTYGASVSTVVLPPDPASQVAEVSLIDSDIYGELPGLFSNPKTDMSSVALSYGYQTPGGPFEIPSTHCDSFVFTGDGDGTIPGPDPLCPLPVPEPTTLALFVIGLAGAAIAFPKRS